MAFAAAYHQARTRVKWLLLDTLLSCVLLPETWRAWRANKQWVRVPMSDPPTPADTAPRVSVLVPARDEAGSIERCVWSLLGQNYPADRLQIVVLDDESSDGTGDLVARIARSDERLTLVRGTPPPTGWLGKPWALHQAVQQVGATSEYLLFTDADTVHEPNALASAVAHARQNGIDLLSLGTGQQLVGPAEKLLLPLLVGLAMVVNGAFDEVNDPRRPDHAKANGQFILVSTGAYARIEGHAAVRGSVVEDFALARRAKRMGLRLQLADGRHLVRTRGYSSAREIWHGFAKNALSEVRRQRGGAAAALVAVPVVGLGPYVVLAVGGLRLMRRIGTGRARLADVLLFGQALLQVGHLLGFTAACSAALGLPARYGLAQPIATLFVWVLLCTAAVKQARGKPAMWKGRAVAELAC